MPGGTIIYHNPRCSKSRQALALLRDRGIEPEIIEYLKSPPTADEIKELVAVLGIEPHDLLRAKEAPYAELGLSTASSLDEIASAIASEPLLLERPIVVRGKRAIIARPPERVDDIL